MGANAYTADRQGQHTKIGAASVPAGVRRTNCDIWPRRILEQAEAEFRWLAAKPEAMEIELREAESP